MDLLLLFTLKYIKLCDHTNNARSRMTPRIKGLLEFIAAIEDSPMAPVFR